MNRAVARVPMRSWPNGQTAKRRAWALLWLPYWLGSTLPPPPWPTFQREPRPGARSPVLLRRLDALRRAVWRRRRSLLALRSLWLALALVDGALLWRVTGHRPLEPRLVLALAGLLLAGGALLIALSRPSRQQLARALDRSFGLRDRVATALEVAESGQLGGVRALQVLEATKLTGEVASARAFQPRLPRRELALVAVTGLLLLGLLLALAIPTSRPSGPGRPGQPGAAGQTGNQPGSAPPASQSGAVPTTPTAGQHGTPAPGTGSGQATPTAGGTGAPVPGQLPGAQKSQSPPGTATPLLGADGKPIELPRGDQGGTPIPAQSNRPGSGPATPGTVGPGGGELRQRPPGDAGGEVNQVPLEQRQAVERYFTPDQQGGR